ncbi:MAG: sugar phosphate isomerase/epimerase family protein [Bryobacteraceae bacterium]
MKTLLGLIAAAALAQASDAPLYVFDDWAGAGALSIAQRVALAQKTGYAGIFYSTTKNIPELLAAHKATGLRLLGVYTGMNLSDAKPGYDPGLPAAIQQLKGTAALIAFTVNGEAPNGDDVAVPIIQEVARMAAQSGLQVALYPHYGLYVARVEDALRVCQKVGRPNVGIVFNLCHWLRSGDEANMMVRLGQALPHILMVSINGADHEGGWDRLIQPLDRGSFDARGFVRALLGLGYKGPVGLQCYNVSGDAEANLGRSMTAWRSF